MDHITLNKDVDSVKDETTLEISRITLSDKTSDEFDLESPGASSSPPPWEPSNVHSDDEFLNSALMVSIGILNNLGENEDLVTLLQAFYYCIRIIYN